MIVVASAKAGDWNIDVGYDTDPRKFFVILDHSDVYLVIEVKNTNAVRDIYKVLSEKSIEPLQLGTVELVPDNEAEQSIYPRFFLKQTGPDENMFWLIIHGNNYVQLKQAFKEIVEELDGSGE